ncbi:MAG: Uma2 family endonuclease [Bacteroidetes bacterium]|nr:Uma2 family endonuclease [Bacteroidota bacterium]
MVTPKIKEDRYSYADYLTWGDQERWEIIHGLAYAMSPAPNTRHQFISGNIHGEFFYYLKGKKCRVFAAPFDIRLSTEKADEESIFTVVQPDISIFCDMSKLDDRGAIGAPDLIVEILSPSTAEKDLNIKLLLYQEYAVKEYWIADPAKETMSVYKLDQLGRYKLVKIYTKEEKVTVGIFPELVIDLKEVFAE